MHLRVRTQEDLDRMYIFRLYVICFIEAGPGNLLFIIFIINSSAVFRYKNILKVSQYES